MERVWRCIRRPRSCNSEMHFEAEIKLNSEMHLEVVIEYIISPKTVILLIFTADSLAMHSEGEIKLNLEMQVEAVIKGVW